MGVLNKYKVNRVENYKGWVIYHSSENVYSAFRGSRFILGKINLRLIREAVDERKERMCMRRKERRW